MSYMPFSFVRRVLAVSVKITVPLLFFNHVVAKEYIVKLKNNQDVYHLNFLSPAADIVYEILDTEENLNLLKIEADTDNLSGNPIPILEDHFDAEYAVENVTLHAFVDASDPRRTEQWALDMVKAVEAWGISEGTRSVVVAVVDSGVAVAHEDLKDNLWVNGNETPNNGIDDDNNGFIDDINGWDFSGNDKDPTDEVGANNPGHGTHCAGIIGASCGNGLGVCGISPKVSLMAVRFLDANGSGDLFASTKAMSYAVNNGAHIISASWGATIPESQAQPIIDAIKHAEERGVIFVAAAVNDGKSNDTASVYPANAQTPNMISVAASNRLDEKPSWSNYGRKVDIAAPGENILSTIPSGYRELSGTSMATPLVSGLVALMKSIDISLTGAVLRSILQTTGKQVNIETASGRRVDAHEALKAVSEKRLTVVPATKTLKPNDTFDFSAWGGTGPYRFSSSNPSVATVDESGHLVAVSEGDVTLEVTDGSGTKASSVSIKIGHSASPSPDTPCPFDNQMLCLIFCGIMPEMPWCKDLPLPELPIPGN